MWRGYYGDWRQGSWMNEDWSEAGRRVWWLLTVKEVERKERVRKQRRECKKVGLLGKAEMGF